MLGRPAVWPWALMYCQWQKLNKFGNYHASKRVIKWRNDNMYQAIIQVQTRILSLCLSTYMYLTPRTSRARILGMHHWLFYVDKLHVHILIIENGQRLLEACSLYDSCITDTFFAIKLQYRSFWRHSRWRHWQPLDLVIASRSSSWPAVTKELTATETIRWLAQDQTGWSSISVLVGRNYSPRHTRAWCQQRTFWRPHRLQQLPWYILSQ